MALPGTSTTPMLRCGVKLRSTAECERQLSNKRFWFGLFGCPISDQTTPFFHHCMDDAPCSHINHFFNVFTLI